MRRISSLTLVLILFILLTSFSYLSYKKTHRWQSDLCDEISTDIILSENPSQLIYTQWINYCNEEIETLRKADTMMFASMILLIMILISWKVDRLGNWREESDEREDESATELGHHLIRNNSASDVEKSEKGEKKLKLDRKFWETLKEKYPNTNWIENPEKEFKMVGVKSKKKKRK